MGGNRVAVADGLVSICDEVAAGETGEGEREGPGEGGAEVDIRVGVGESNGGEDGIGDVPLETARVPAASGSTLGRGVACWQAARRVPSAPKLRPTNLRREIGRIRPAAFSWS